MDANLFLPSFAAGGPLPSATIFGDQRANPFIIPPRPTHMAQDQFRATVFPQPYYDAPGPDNYSLETNEIRRAYRQLHRTEPTVRAALDGLVESIACLDVSVLPADEDDPEDCEAAEFLDWTVQQSSLGWDGLITTILTPALVDGYSVSEIKMGGFRDDKKYGTGWGLGHIKNKDTLYVRLVLDVYRNILGVTNVVRGLETYSPEKVIILTIDEMYSNPFGSSPLRAAYRTCMLIEAAYKLWHIALQMYSMPFLVGKYAQNRIGFDQMLQDARAGGWIMIPEADKVEVTNLASATSFQAFESKIRLLREDVYMAIRGSFLAFLQGTASNQGDTKTHKVASDAKEYLKAKQIGRVLSHQLAPHIVRPNYARAGIPKIVLGGVNWEETKNQLQVCQQVLAMGKPISAKYVYKTSQVSPPMDENDTIPGQPQQGQQQAGGQMGIGGPPGLPPRPGYQWNQQTHRWYKPGEDDPDDPFAGIPPSPNSPAPDAAPGAPASTGNATPPAGKQQMSAGVAGTASDSIAFAMAMMSASDEGFADNLHTLAGMSEQQFADRSHLVLTEIRPGVKRWVNPNKEQEAAERTKKAEERTAKGELTPKDQLIKNKADAEPKRQAARDYLAKVQEQAGPITQDQIAELKTHIDHLTRNEMREHARAMAQKVGGVKADLAQRIVEAVKAKKGEAVKVPEEPKPAAAEEPKVKKAPKAEPEALPQPPPAASGVEGKPAGEVKMPFPQTQHLPDELRKHVREQIPNAQTRDVRLDKLHAIQPGLNAEHVNDLVSGKTPADYESWDGDVPTVVKHNGKESIYAGHHRLAAEKIKGNATAKAKYIDLDANPPKEPERNFAREAVANAIKTHGGRSPEAGHELISGNAVTVPGHLRETLPEMTDEQFAGGLKRLADAKKLRLYVDANPDELAKNPDAVKVGDKRYSTIGKGDAELTAGDVREAFGGKPAAGTPTPEKKPEQSANNPSSILDKPAAIADTPSVPQQSAGAKTEGGTVPNTNTSVAKVGGASGWVVDERTTKNVARLKKSYPELSDAEAGEIASAIAPGKDSPNDSQSYADAEKAAVAKHADKLFPTPQLPDLDAASEAQKKFATETRQRIVGSIKRKIAAVEATVGRHRADGKDPAGYVDQQKELAKWLDRIATVKSAKRILDAKDLDFTNVGSNTEDIYAKRLGVSL